MNNPLLSPSLAQQEYLADQLRRRSMIRIWRILLLILILSLWELSASLGLIDRFIFSSPSLILKCLISMTADRTIFLHTGVTLMETSYKLCCLYRSRSGLCPSSLGQSLCCQRF